MKKARSSEPGVLFRVRLPQEFISRVCSEAALLNKSQSTVVREALENYFAKETTGDLMKVLMGEVQKLHRKMDKTSSMNSSHKEAFHYFLFLYFMQNARADGHGDAEARKIAEHDYNQLIEHLKAAARAARRSKQPAAGRMAVETLIDTPILLETDAFYEQLEREASADRQGDDSQLNVQPFARRVILDEPPRER